MSGAEEIVSGNQRIEETVAANDRRKDALVDQSRSLGYAIGNGKPAQLFGDFLFYGLVNLILPLDFNDADRPTRLDKEIDLKSKSI